MSYFWSASRRVRTLWSSSSSPVAGMTRRPSFRSRPFCVIGSTRNAAPSAETSTAPGRKPSLSLRALGMTSRPALSMVVLIPEAYHRSGKTHQRQASAALPCSVLSQPTYPGDRVDEKRTFFRSPRRPEWKMLTLDQSRQRLIERWSAVVATGGGRKGQNVLRPPITSGRRTTPPVGPPLDRWVDSLAVKAPSPGCGGQLAEGACAFELDDVKHESNLVAEDAQVILLYRAAAMDRLLERARSLELPTSTLGRLRSTRVSYARSAARF